MEEAQLSAGTHQSPNPAWQRAEGGGWLGREGSLLAAVSRAFLNPSLPFPTPPAPATGRVLRISHRDRWLQEPSSSTQVGSSRVGLT